MKRSTQILRPFACNFRRSSTLFSNQTSRATAVAFYGTPSSSSSSTTAASASGSKGPGKSPSEQFNQTPKPYSTEQTNNLLLAKDPSMASSENKSSSKPQQQPPQQQPPQQQQQQQKQEPNKTNVTGKPSAGQPTTQKRSYATTKLEKENNYDSSKGYVPASGPYSGVNSGMKIDSSQPSIDDAAKSARDKLRHPPGSEQAKNKSSSDKGDKAAGAGAGAGAKAAGSGIAKGNTTGSVDSSGASSRISNSTSARVDTASTAQPQKGSSPSFNSSGISNPESSRSG